MEKTNITFNTIQSQFISVTIDNFRAVG